MIIQVFFACYIFIKMKSFKQNSRIFFHCRLLLKLVQIKQNVLFFSFLRINWVLWTILKTRNKRIWSNVFSYVKVCIFWKCIQYTIHLDKTQVLKKFHSDKTNGTKNVLFLLQLITILLLIWNSYMRWSTKFVSLKLCGVCHFQFCFTFIKVHIFIQQNAWTLWL